MGETMRAIKETAGAFRAWRGIAAVLRRNMGGSVSEDDIVAHIRDTPDERLILESRNVGAKSMEALRRVIPYSPHQAPSLTDEQRRAVQIVSNLLMDPRMIGVIDVDLRRAFKRLQREADAMLLRAFACIDPHIWAYGLARGEQWTTSADDAIRIRALFLSHHTDDELLSMPGMSQQLIEMVRRQYPYAPDVTA